MNAREWARAYRAMAEELERIAAEASAERRDWTPQESSPLGRRRHVAAVRRRVGAGDRGAAMVGRRALLSHEALAEELAAMSKRPRAREQETTRGRLERRLGLVGAQ